MKWKKLIINILVIVMVFSLSACGGAKDGATTPPPEKVVLHAGATVTTDHAWYRASVLMAKEIAEKSNGTMELVLDFNGVLGAGKEICEAVQNGSLAMGVDGDIAIAQVIRGIEWINLPYIFKDLNDVDTRYYNGWIGEAVKAGAREGGIEILSFTDSDFRWISNSKRPIQKPEDLKGLKLRVPPSLMFTKFFEELGTLPTAMGITEVASALQQKVIDGQDNGPIVTFNFGLNEFQPYMTKTNHSFAGAGWYIGTKTLEALTQEQQDILRTAAENAAVECTKMMREDAKTFEAGIAKTTQILESTPELDAAFREAAAKVWANPEVTSAYPKEVIDRLLAEAAAK